MPRDPRKNRILGDRCAICPHCGYGRRYLVGVTMPDDDKCPDCGTVLVVDCAACGEPLRPAELFGVPIRRKAEPPATPVVDNDS